MAVDIAQPIKATINLDSGLVQTPMRTVLAYGDKDANKIVVTVLRGKEPADLTGVSASGVFYRPPEGDNVPLEGSVKGNVVTVLLNEHCYAAEGNYTANVSIGVGGAHRTILSITGNVVREGNDVLIAVENVVPSLDELLMQIQALRDTTARANAAADRVERMQIDASGLAGDSNMLGGKAPEYYLQPVNLLDNSYFVDPVMQAGFNGMHGGEKYVIDRWLHMYQLGTAEKTPNGISLTGPEFYMSQKSKKDVTGKTLTFAVCLADGTIICGASNVGDLSETITFAQSGELYLMLTNGYFTIRASGTSTYTIKWSALYKGSYTADTLPPYVPKDNELEKCILYHQPLGGNGQSLVHKSMGYGYLIMPLSARKMRVTPSAQGSIIVISPNGFMEVDASDISIYDSPSGYIATIPILNGHTFTDNGSYAVSGTLALNADL